MMRMREATDCSLVTNKCSMYAQRRFNCLCSLTTKRRVYFALLHYSYGRLHRSVADHLPCHCDTLCTVAMALDPPKLCDTVSSSFLDPCLTGTTLVVHRLRRHAAADAARMW